MELVLFFLPMRGTPCGGMLLEGSMENLMGAGVGVKLGEVMGRVCGKRLEKDGRPSFPTLFDLTAQKEAMVVNIWDNTREGGGLVPSLY